MLFVYTTGNKGTTAFCMSQLYNKLWYSFMVKGLVLSCQIQDDLSVYYNMVASNGKMDPNARKSVQIKRNLNGSKPATSEGLITQSL